MIKIFGFYFLSSIATSAIPFLMLPVFTRILTTIEFAQVSIFLMISSLYGCILGLSSNTFNEINYHKVKEHDYRVYKFHSVVITVVTFIVLISLTMLFSKYISDFFEIDTFTIYLSLLNALFVFFYVSLLGQFVIKKYPVKHGFVSIFLVSLNSLIGFYFVDSLELGFQGRVYSIILPSFLLLLFYSIFMIDYKAYANIKIDYKILIRIFFYGGPLIPHLIGGVLLVSGERALVSKFLDLHSVAVAAVTIQFVSALTLIGQNVNKVYIPWLYEKLSENEINFSKITKTLLVLLFLITLSVIPCYYLLPDIYSFFVGVKYKDGTPLVFILSLGALLHITYFIFGNFLFYKGRNKEITIISVFSACMHLSLMYLLLPDYGLVAIGYSFIVVRASQVLLTINIVYKDYPKLFSFNYLLKK